MTVKQKALLSQTYAQLSNIFKYLEDGNYIEGVDFGENLTCCFQWFLSPSACVFLEKRYEREFNQTLTNSRFTFVRVPWQNNKTMGLDIKLNL